MIEVHHFKPIPLTMARDFKRADLEVYGINHFCPSYSALVFFNPDDTDLEKATRGDKGCVAAFAMFAHSQCTGDEGHCHPSTPLRFDPRRSHPLTKAFKRVVVTEGLRAAMEDGDTLRISIVVSDEEGHRKPRGKAKAKEPEPRKLFVCDGLQIATFA